MENDDNSLQASLISGERGLQASPFQQHQSAYNNPHERTTSGALQQTLSLHTSWPFSGKAELCRARAAVCGIRNTAQQKPMNPICSPGSQLAHFLLTPGSPSSNFKLQLQRSCNGHASWPFGVAHEPSRLFQVSDEPFRSQQSRTRSWRDPIFR